MQHYTHNRITAVHLLQQQGFQEASDGSFRRGHDIATIISDGKWFVAEYPVGFQ